MTYALFRVVYTIYIVVALILLLIWASKIIFAKAKPRPKSFLAIILWPLALLSVTGRETINDACGKKGARNDDN